MCPSPHDRPSRARPLAQRIAEIEAAMVETPIVRLEHDSLELFAKLELCNVVGSIKDRPAFWMLRDAIERGEVSDTTTIIESSSGNMASALAAFCRTLGLRFIPVIDPNTPPGSERFLRAACEQVIKVTERDDTGGYLGTRLRRIAQLKAELGDVYWTNQYGNVAAMEAHYQLTGGEVVRRMAELDYAFIGVSSGGTLAGLSRRLKRAYPSITIVAVDAVGSVIFGGKPRRRSIAGVGSSVVPELLRHAQVDEVVEVSEPETVAGCRRLLDRHGIFAGGSSGSGLAAVDKLAPRIARAGVRPKVLFLCPDRGGAYIDTVYDADWVRRNVQDDAVAP